MEDITKEIKMCIETNENESMTTQTLWDSVKAVLKGKFYTNTTLPQETREKSNNLTLHLKQLEEEDMKNSKVSRSKGIIKIRAEINEKETKETITKINKTKRWFFEEINKTKKPLVILIK